jgi:murein L,D-transpeptidase YcbB/YkuD
VPRSGRPSGAMAHAHRVEAREATREWWGTRGSHANPEQGPALDRLLTRGDIQVAEARLKDFDFDPGPVDGRFTAQTQAAVRAFQARYGLPVSGLLDRPTREELKLGVDPVRTG